MSHRDGLREEEEVEEKKKKKKKMKIPSPLEKTYGLGSAPLAKGGFGTVCAGKRFEDGLPVAIKTVEKRNVRNWAKSHAVPMEVLLLERVRGVKGVAEMLDCYETPDTYVIVMERPEAAMDLFDYVAERGFLEENLCRFFFRQIVESVSRCQDRGVVHGDIKDENVVLDLENMTTTIVDFGSGAFLEDGGSKFYGGTLEFSPPEWFSSRRYDFHGTTVWSLGVLLYVMACGKLPFENEEEIVKTDLRFEDERDGKKKKGRIISPECRDLIRRCLSRRPGDRPTLEEILDHPWWTSNFSRSESFPSLTFFSTPYSTWEDVVYRHETN